MAQVVVVIAGRTYRMSCENGQEAHLERLADDVDARMAEMKKSFGEIGEQRLVVMTALAIADDLASARRKMEDLETAMHAAVRGQEEAAAGNDARVAELEATIDATTARIGLLLERLAAKG